MDLQTLVVRNEVLGPDGRRGEWDSIVMDETSKARLLRSVVLGLGLRATVPFEVSALHGLALLVGPPGTGKSTLVRGLAGQVAGLVQRKQCRLLEVNPHGLMSAEHGQSQQRVHQLLTEVVPMLAEDRTPTILMLDEVESIAVARGAASLAANPADVHRATDAVLTGLDELARGWPHIFTVATSNFSAALDDAFKSRADVTIAMPLPDELAISSILRDTLRGFGDAYPRLRRLAGDPHIADVARLLRGQDGRNVRKTVTDAMLIRKDVTIDPGALTIDDLLEAATLRTLTEMEQADATL